MLVYVTVYTYTCIRTCTLYCVDAEEYVSGCPLANTIKCAEDVNTVLIDLLHTRAT